MRCRSILLVVMAACSQLCAAESGPASVSGVTEHLGQKVPGSLQFTDQDGKTCRIADFCDGHHPVLLIPAYYTCPMLCGLVLKAAVDATKRIELTPGLQYHIVVVSFNPDDRPYEATRKQQAVLSAVSGDRRFTPGTWPFLCGSQANINQLLTAIGEQVHREDGNFAHPAIMVVLNGDGVISRYLYGIDTQPSDLRFALMEASAGRIGSLTERVLLYCYQYDPTTHRYGLFVVGFMKFGGLLVFGGFILLIWILVRSAARRARA